MLKLMIHIAIISFLWFITDVHSKNLFLGILAPLIVGSYALILLFTFLYKIGVLKGKAVPGNKSNSDGGGFFYGASGDGGGGADGSDC